MGKSFFYTKLAFSNIKKNHRFYIPFCLSAIGTIMMFYIMSALGPSIDTESVYGGTTLTETMKLGVNVIAIFAVIFIFYTNSFVIKRRKKELGLFNMLGMEKKHIGMVILLETLFIAVFCLVVGILAGIAMSKVMFLILENLIQVTAAIHFTVPTGAIVSTLILFACIFGLTLIYNLLQIIRTKPIELLHGDAIGEKEPKSNWLLAVLGILLLGGGYYLSITIEDPVSALMFFMVAVILVILGTYLLFIFAITVILKMLKKNKKFYYQTKHFASVSGMLYRMKQNAAGLATICILSTCVLVMVGTTTSLYVSMNDILTRRYPHEISLTAYNSDDETAESLRGIITDTIQASGVKAENLSEMQAYYTVVYGDGNKFYYGAAENISSPSQIQTVAVVTAQEYNRLFSENVQLAEDEALIAMKTELADDHIELYGHRLNVRQTDYSVISDMQSYSYGDNIFLVVSDTAVAEKLLTIDDERTSTANYFYAFDMEGTDEEKTAMRVRIQEAITAAYGDSLSTMIETRAENTDEFYILYGGLFFLGIFLGIVFMMALVLIIYYKQISEGYEDKRRFEIMQNVGMSHAEVKSSIHSQILMIFFIPLLTAFIHLAFAMPMIIRILAVLNLMNVPVILLASAVVAALFAVVYVIVYLLTARTYYKIVEA